MAEQTLQTLILPALLSLDFYAAPFIQAEEKAITNFEIESVRIGFGMVTCPFEVSVLVGISLTPPYQTQSNAAIVRRQGQIVSLNRPPSFPLPASFPYRSPP